MKHRKNLRKSQLNQPSQRTCRFQQLEQRTLLASDLAHVFATYDGAVPTQQEFDFRVRAEQFALEDGSARLGFLMQADIEGQFDPAPVTILDSGGGSLSPQLQRADINSNGTSLAIFELPEGNFILQTTAESGVGNFSLEVFLVGDANGDRQVDGVDRMLHRGAFGNTVVGETIPEEADSNLDGRVSAYDQLAWRLNLNESITLPLAVTDVVDAIETLPGSFTTQAETVTLQGTSLSEVKIGLDVDGNGQFDDGQTTSSADGTFSFELSLVEGMQNVSVQVTDDFGMQSLETIVIKRLPSDTSRPTVSAQLSNDTGTSSTDQLTNDSTISGYVSDNDSGVASLTASVDGDAAIAVPFDSSGNFTFDPGFARDGSADGQHTVRFVGTDQSGNVSEFRDVTFLLDTLAPSTPTVELAPSSDTGTIGDNLTTESLVKLVGQAEPSSFLEVAPGGRTSTSNSTGEYSIPAVQLLLGPNELTVSVYDLAGNLADATTSITRDALESDILLAEGSGFVQEHRQLVDVGPADGARLLRFDIDTMFDTSDASSPVEDLFAVYLVDPANPSTTVFDRGVAGTSLFSLSGGRAEYATGLVRFDGTTVEIDVSGVESLTEAELVLQLLNHDSDTGTQVAIRDLEVVVDEDIPAASLLNGAEVIQQPGVAANIEAYSVATGVELEVENIRFDEATGDYVAEVRLNNSGPSTGRQVAVRFPGLPAEVQLTNASGIDAFGVPYVNYSDAVRSGGLGRNELSQPVELRFSNPSARLFQFQPEVLTAGENRAPDVQQIGPLNVFPGGVLTVPILATDLDGDRLTFQVTSESDLPTNLLNADGVLTFSPTLEEIGNYSVTIHVSDGTKSSTQLVTLSVSADPISTTRLSGKVLDTNSQPLVGVPIELGTLQTLTDNDGGFLLEATTVFDSDTLFIRGEAISGLQTYPFIAEKLPLLLGRDAIDGVENVVARPIYLPVLDTEQAEAIDPAADTMVTANLRPNEAPAEVFVAAGTLEDQAGAPFTGLLSITEVPPDLTPAALPSNLLMDVVVTIQPGEMVFTSPAPLTFPNRAGWAPGTPMNLWSINPVTGEFDDVGDMVVSSDGATIVTVSGGVRNSSWHGPAPDPTNPTNQTPLINCGCAKPAVSVGSEAELGSGAYLEDHTVASYQSLGVNRTVTLRYDSARANPVGTVRFDYEVTNPTVLAPTASGDPLLMARLDITTTSGAVMTAPGSGSRGDNFWSVSGAEANVNIGAALSVDLRSQPTGIFDYTLDTGFVRMSDDGLISGSTERLEGSILNVNSAESPFGSGWSLAGWQQIVEETNLQNRLARSVMLIDGDGSELLFVNSPVPGQKGIFFSPPGDFSKLVQLEDNTYQRTMTDGTVYQFNDDNNLATVTDRNDNVTTYFYNEDDQVSGVVDPAGLTTELVYEDGRVSEIVDPSGRATELHHDADGNLMQINDPDASSRNFDYDNRGLLTAEIDKLGNREVTNYDHAGRVQAVVRSDGSSVRLRSASSIGSYLQSTTNSATASAPAILDFQNSAVFIDGNGHTTTYSLGPSYLLMSAFDDVGRQYSIERAENNLVTSYVDGNANTTEYLYDANGNLQTSTAPSVSVAIENPEGFREYADSRIDLGERMRQIRVGDFNNDGIADVVGTTVSGPILIAFGLSGGGFTEPQTAHPGPALIGSGLEVGDVDNDGNLDLLRSGRFTTSSSQFVEVLKGNGSGELESAASIVPSIGERLDTFFVSDADMDGDVDVVLQSTVQRPESFGEQAILELFVNEGNMQFLGGTTMGGSIGTGPTPVSVIGDIDNDGPLDFAMTDRPHWRIDLFRLNNLDGFTLIDSIDLRQFLPGNVAGSVNDIVFADTTGDGITDLSLLYRSSFASDSVLLSATGNGDGTFEVPIVLREGVNGQLGVIDFDMDGQNDFVLSELIETEFGLRNGISVLTTRPNGETREQTRFLTSTVGKPKSHDLSGDSINDLYLQVGSSFSSHELHIFEAISGGGYRVESITTLPDRARAYATGLTKNAASDSVLIAASDGIREYISSPSGGLIQNGMIDFVGGGLNGFIWDIATSDLSGDGIDEIITVDVINNNVHILHSSDDYTPENAQVLSETGDPRSTAVGDVTGDSIPDLLVTHQNNSEVLIYEGSELGLVSFMSRMSVGLRPSDMVLFDANNDSILDLALSLEGSREVSVMLGTVAGTFIPELKYPVDADPSTIEAGDVNGDGFIDLITIGSNSDVVSVLTGSANGTFASSVAYRIRGLDGGAARLKSLVVADINADGKDDISVAHFGSGLSGEVTILRQSSNGELMPERYSAANGPEALLAYDANGDRSVDLITFSDSGVGHTLLNGVTASVGKAGPSRASSFDPLYGLATSRTDELGRTTTYDIDPDNGNTLEVVRPGGIRTLLSYVGTGQIDTTTDDLGRTTKFEYDDEGRTTKITFALGTPDQGSQRFEYDDAGNQTAFIDENGNRSEFEYDELNRLTLTRDPVGDTTRFEYDNAGNLIKSIDARGNVTRNRYDERNRLIATIAADGSSTSFDYDNEGNLTLVVDPLGNVTQNFYDARNRSNLTIDPDGGRTAFTYDGNDNLTSLIDPVGNTTIFIYDARDRLVREIDPLGNATEYAYDAADNLIRKTDRNERVSQFAYDDLDRLTTETWVGGGNTIDYTYDDVDNLLSVSDSFSALAFTYDSRDRVKMVDNAGTPGAPNVVLTYGYDAVGNVTSVSDVIDGLAGATTIYEYDNLNRTMSIEQSGTGASEKAVDFLYNELGQFQAISRYSALDRSSLVARTDYAYDELNRLTNLDHTNVLDEVLAFYDFDYDSASRITRIADIDGVTNYSYDDRSQLTGADRADGDSRGDESYDYDANGNRENSHLHGSGYVTGDGNRLLSDGTYNYQYENEGNMTRRTEIASGEYRVFDWDHRNRLTRVTDFSDSGIITQEVGFAYDGLDRRVLKAVDLDGEDAGTETALHFVYDREDVLLDFLDSDGIAGISSPALEQRYLHGPHVDQVLAIELSSIDSKWLLTDHLGTITVSVSTDGIVDKARYDSFGIRENPFISRFGLAGREYDSELELYYNRARYYDPQVGKFISVDPIGLAGGANLFRYANNLPILLVDPTGLEPVHLGPNHIDLDTPKNVVKFARQNQGFKDKAGRISSNHVQKTQEAINRVQRLANRGEITRASASRLTNVLQTQLGQAGAASVGLLKFLAKLGVVFDVLLNPNTNVENEAEFLRQLRELEENPLYDHENLLCLLP